MLGSDAGGVTEEHGQHWHWERASRNPAHTLGLGKEELEFCMSSVTANKTGTDTPCNISQGVQRERREQMSLRSSAGSILGKHQRS